MRLNLSRRVIAVAAAVGLTAAVPALTTIAPASAAPQSVHYSSCDVRKDYDDPDASIAKYSWTAQIEVGFEYEQPYVVESPIPTTVQITNAFPLPAGETGLSDAYAQYFLWARASDGGDEDLHRSYRQVGGLTRLVEIPMGTAEKDVYFYNPGVVTWTAGELHIYMDGYVDGGETYVAYYVHCTAPQASPTLATIGVWDPAAAAALSFPGSVVQGGSATIAASKFRPGENLRLSIDGTQVANKPADISGSASHRWTANTWLKPGKHTVTARGALSDKTVSKTFTVVAGAAKASVKPKKVKSGKKATVTGSLFKPGEKVTAVLRRTAGGKGLKSKKVATVTASTTGTLKKKFKVVKKFKKGKHQLTLTGATSGRTAVANVTVKAAKKK